MKRIQVGELESAESEYATGRRRLPLTKNWVCAVSGLCGGLEGDMVRKNDSESSEPLADGLGRQVCRYSAGAAYNPRCGEIAAWR